MPQILYHDDQLIVVQKPVGLLAQAAADGDDSLPKRLEAQGLAVKPVHRLDRATGGVMVYALTGESAAALSVLVQDHGKFIKEYLAVVRGTPSSTCGEMEDLLFHDVRRNKSYVVDRKRSGVKSAKLAYEVLETVGTQDGAMSLVRVRLYTGRTHQIRVQFASRHVPLLGDSRYGGSRNCPLALWSHRLTFPHPVSGEQVDNRSIPDINAFPWNLFDEKYYK
ncbi:MAG: RluA family pseudouridine synthase [Clostridia bacterium]|nr:RluA family pseudouridine synthase [Clostridia bacterium]